MIFDRFIKPKWQHRNPDVRKLAVDKLQDISVLSELAQHDESAIVRRAAVYKILDLPLLEKILQQDVDSSVRELATQRFKQLLSGQKDSCPPLNIRLAYLYKIADADLLEHIAVHGQEYELRLAALQQVERESLLGDMAISDPNNTVRLAAVEKLSQKSTLERVLKSVRNHDKQVSRIARDKLDALLVQAERPERLKTEGAALCVRAEALGRVTSAVSVDGSTQEAKWEADYSEWQTIQERWQILTAEISTLQLSGLDGIPFDRLRERFIKAQQVFTAAYEHYQQSRETLRLYEATMAPLRAARRSLCEQAETLLADLQNYPRLNETEGNEFEQRLNALQTQWTANFLLDDVVEEQQWQNRFDRATKTLQKRVQDLRLYDTVAIQLETICARTENLCTNNTLIKQKHIMDLQDKWAAVTQPSRVTPLLSDLNNRFKQGLQALQAHSQQQAEQRKQALQELQQLLQTMEAELMAGELHAALPLEQRGRDLLQILTGGLPADRYQALENRLQQSTSKIRELRSWQRWGDDRERENLCLQMESLVASLSTDSENNPENKSTQHEDLEEVARLVQAARQNWQKLGTSGRSHKLWERFNKACRLAYQPCQVYFAAKAQERQQNLVQKQAVCEQLERFVKTTDWQQPNWKEIAKQAQEIEKTWNSIGIVDAKVKNTIKTRFSKSMTIVQDHLKEEQERSYQHRQRLLEKAKAAHAIESLNDAIEEVKHLQALWQISVPGKRKEERQLWKEFRTACDVVFERRKQYQDAIKQERQVQLDAKVALCEQVEALALLTGDALKTAPNQVKKIRLAWSEDMAGSARLPKNAFKAVETRFEQACVQVDQCYQAQLLAEQRAQLEQLKQKASLCRELEQTQITDENEVTAKIAAIRETWATLPVLTDAALETVIAQRFERACLNDRQLDATALKLRETLCIRMEILAGVESPPEVADARMAYQVSRLSEAMSNGEGKSTNKLVEAQAIARDWYLHTTLVGESITSLENRFNRACEAFYVHNQHTE